MHLKSDTHIAHKLLLIREHILIIFAYLKAQLKSFQMYEYHKHTNQSCTLFYQATGEPGVLRLCYMPERQNVTILPVSH